MQTDIHNRVWTLHKNTKLCKLATLTCENNLLQCWWVINTFFKSPAIEVYGPSMLLLPGLRVLCWFFAICGWKIVGRFEDWTRNLRSSFSVYISKRGFHTSHIISQHLSWVSILKQVKCICAQVKSIPHEQWLCWEFPDIPSRVSEHSNSISSIQVWVVGIRRI